MYDERDRTISILTRKCEELEWDRARSALKLCAFIDYWHHEAFVGTPIADEVELWRIVDDAKEDLKARLPFNM